MKKVAVMVMAAFMMTALPTFAAEGTKEQKDQCLLASKECRGEVDSIQKKIKKLDAEIKKGKKVYTADEIKKLQQKLDEADQMLDTLLKN